jgi:uncharacterized protein (DUF885 family)
VTAPTAPQESEQQEQTKTQKSRSSKPKEADEKARTFFEASFKERLDRSPMFQTRLGIKDNYGKWDDLSEAFERETHEITVRQLKKLRDFIQRDQLNAVNRLSYDLFVDSAERDIRGYEYRYHNYPLNQMYGWQSTVPAFLINMHRIANAKDAEDYVRRLKGIEPLFKQVIANVEARAELGVIPPKFVFAYVLEDCHNMLRGVPFERSEEDNTLLADFKKKVSKLDLDQPKKAELVAKAMRALTDNVSPAYLAMISSVTALEKRATTDDGAWKRPEGAAYYDFRLQRMTTTTMTADEIHEIGVSEVARIHEEMRGIMHSVGYAGTLGDFFSHLRQDPKFYYEDSDAGREQYLEEATALIDSMKSRLDELFITKPKAGMVVKRVEPFREKSAGKAFYERPAPDGSRPGTYYANLYRMADMPIYQMEALAYHEGIPGHHMQIAIAMELENFPSFRKHLRYTAYTEGWALYTEFIPKEMGLYADPYSDFGRLAMELWRACRLVVDTGIHVKKWTREEAVDYLVENTPNPEGDAIKAIERYIVMPGQATAYKIGMLKILELREGARLALGDHFDIREFHDVVLRNGPVPLTTLEMLVDNWVESKAEVQ